MGGSVEIYVKYTGEWHRLAHQVAEALQVVSYFYSGHHHVLPVDARQWIGVEGWGQLILARTDLGQEGEPGAAEGTAFAPYEYELSLSFRSTGGADALQRFGRAIFDRLTTLGLPLAYGGDGLVFADFLPGRGVRDFPAETDAEEDGRAWWFDPRLHNEPAAPWPGELPDRAAPPRPVVAFETDGLLQFVPMAEEGGQLGWLTPVASARSSVGARELGLLLGCAQSTTAAPGTDARERIILSLAAKARLSVEDFFRRSVCMEIRPGEQELIIEPRTPSGRPAGPQVPGADAPHLGRRIAGSAPPDAVGGLLLSLVDAVRSHTST